MVKKSSDEEIRAALKATSGNRGAAAELLNVKIRGLYARLARMDNRPLSSEAESQNLRPSAVLTDGDGNIKLQWLKPDKAIVEEEAAAILDGMLSKIPRVQPVPPPRKNLAEDLMSLYVLTDYHLGMLAWGEETGADWDLKIAERLLLDWFGAAIKQSPPATHGILCQLGDFLHYDSFESVTPVSRHILDADSRPQKMIRVALRILRQLIELLLRKHDTVYVLMAEGNHDIFGSAWLREAFALMYENEPRVVIETRPDPYYAYEWGETVLFFHHGHLRKPANVSEILVRKFREIYGRCTKAYAHMGHLHHRDAKEKALMEVEQHPTLAAADAFASRGGWLSERVAKVITYHKKYGEVGRIGITPEMMKGLNDGD